MKALSIILNKVFVACRKFGRKFPFDMLLAALFCCLGLFFYVIQRGKKISKDTTKDNIVVIGWRFYNKGSQAMALTIIDRLKRKYPNKNVYFFRFDVSNENEKSLYNFPILHFSLGSRLRLLLPALRPFRSNGKHNYIDKKISDILKEASAIIDISGFILSSQWSLGYQIKYILNIMIARKYAVPFHIFPQSLGPFEYPRRYKVFLYTLLQLYLQYPVRVFSREKEGYDAVCKIRSSGLDVSYDIVIQNDGYDLANIYKDKIVFKAFDIENGTVGLVPNLRMMQQTDPEPVFSLYKSVIEQLIKSRKTIYIFRHSREDLEVCEEIRKSFLHHQAVRLITDDLNCIELENLIKQFDFLIASRYHAVVHSYKNNVPCLTIGWADKYRELMEKFSQEDYLFDCRGCILDNDIRIALARMIRNHTYESSKIAEDIGRIQGKESQFYSEGHSSVAREQLLAL